ncbi:Fe-S cluster assembly protein SufD [Deinococcus metallilatus]|uniref:Fe-S cluster assembly protein SufD n=1 Tax=Deinococcus metallilatus TaxID=1211322 RepID=A0AAJ5F6J9_9DEIO|nr:Fe-S cluster assembly protein SufD [Deinococcus metallilatus]MBB5295386.1 Fe-S cluster assembly protein SufD [Deinococcus metallilatus]QBY08084.1 Fe-S cluster assembly protein SufD [Deinococcus metallilatus]RXJ12977.1 Fe-S cluster assembly protein SufD [Deinococcus metallilatus]TLK27101.1 Fe-S cluster assembly protein SufD [Deinococcus metallilatus]GMA16063.1 Fe-S cluster assembly protein SufD [Deinococcus metallilatus]
MTQFTDQLTEYSGPDWLTAKRRESLDLFNTLEVPSESVEAWKYTRVDVDFSELRPHPKRERVTDISALPESVQKRLTSTDVGAYLVLDGPDVVYATELPAELREKGVIFTDLKTAVEQHADKVQQYLYSVVPAEVPDDTTIAAPGTTPSKSPDPSEGKFSALAAALWTNGAFVYVPRGVEVELPLGSFRVMSEAGTYTATRTLVVAEENAQVTFIDEQDSEELPGTYAIGAVELVVKQGARLRYVSIQNWGKGVTHIQRQRGDVARDAVLNSLVVTMGGTLSRTEMQSYLRGQGSDSEMLALYFANEDQHFDHYTLQHHAAPHAHSDLLYKGVNADQSVGVFSGMIKVDLGAQKTDAYQKHRTLMLSSEAQNYSVPQLEINANDVRCSHGSTTGPVNQEALFFLRSRGIHKELAEKMLVTAFLEDVLSRVPLQSVVKYIEGIIAQKVGAA